MMRKETLIVLAVAFLLLPSSVHAGLLSSLTNFCNTSITGSESAAVSSGGISGVVTISLVIVLFMLMALGIFYALGYGFGIDSVKNFTKTEMMESVFTLVIIILVGAGLAFASGAMSFVANLGLSGIQAAASSFSGYVPAPQVSGSTCSSSSYVYETSCSVPGTAGSTCYTQQEARSQLCPQSSVIAISGAGGAYRTMCTNLVGNGVATGINNIIPSMVTLFVLNIFKETTVYAMPYGMGFTFQPFAGLDPVINIVQSQLNIYFVVIMIYVGISFLLIFIYNVFPIFLYGGVLLRSFPWTRAAGGSLIAFFIAFYIIFPAILYPFTLYISTLNANIGAISSISAKNIATQSSYTAIEGLVFGAAMVSEIQGFAESVGYIGVQIIGVLIAFLISYDLVEVLGDVLGAPSLHSRNLLSKMI